MLAWLFQPVARLSLKKSKSARYHSGPPQSWALPHGPHEAVAVVAEITRHYKRADRD
jgi:hypothetical protein